MRYIMARHEKERRDVIYRIYITDTLYQFVGLDKRYIDMVSKATAPTGDPEEIIERIRSKLDELGEED